MDLASLPNTLFDVVIIGAGPAGLSCAIEAQRKGLTVLVLDKGSLCNSIRCFPYDMTFYSTAELLEIGGIPFTCTSARPSRVEVLQYYRRVAQRENIRCALYTELKGVQRLDNGSFNLQTSGGALISRFVIVATGYFDTTNELECDGSHLPHVHRYYTEAFAYTGTRVVVVGGRNSAVETALDLWRHGVEVHIVHRGPGIAETVKYWQKPDIENRINAGEIRAHFNSRLVKTRAGQTEIENIESGQRELLAADYVIPHIGYRPSESLFRMFGIDYNNENLRAEIDTDSHESSVPGVYLAGSVLCGCKVWNIFIENGREHAVPIVRHITQKSLSV